MKLRIYYWLSIAVFGAVHLYQLLRFFGLTLPFIFSFLLTLLVVLFLAKFMRIQLGVLGARSHGRLYILQVLNALLYLGIETGTGYVLIPSALFVLIEMIRHRMSEELLHTEKQLSRQRAEMIEMNETFLTVRKERHDFLKHISALHYMLENNRAKEAKNYLDELVEGYKETNLSIQGERGSVAAMLHQHYRKGKDKGIEVIYDLEASISSLPLAEPDVTALIGNMLENALEASEAWQQEKQRQAHITLQAYRRSGLFILTCQNDTLPIPNHVLDRLFTKQAATTKPGKLDGLGTRIIAETAEKYSGYLDFTYKNETFTLTIKLPAIGKVQH